MADDPEQKPPEQKLPEKSDDLPPKELSEESPSGSLLPRGSTPPQEEFPEKLYCHQCRRMYAVKTLRAKSNTLLTEAALVCPRCRRKLRRMKLKDWYDHYVQGQPKDFSLDTHGMVHRDPAGESAESQTEAEGSQQIQAPPPQSPRGQGNRDPRQQQGRRSGHPNDRRNAGRGGERGQGREEPRQNQKKSILPQNVKAYRLPKRRRLRGR